MGTGVIQRKQPGYLAILLSTVGLGLNKLLGSADVTIFDSKPQRRALCLGHLVDKKLLRSILHSSRHRQSTFFDDPLSACCARVVTIERLQDC